MTVWNEELIELLKKMRADGISAPDIAQRLGNGFTRNSVLGKAFRLGLDKAPPKTQLRQSMIAARRLRAKARPRIRPALPPPMAVEALPMTNEVGTIPFADTDHRHCMWIPGDPRVDARVCGKPRVPDSSWCAAHKPRAYQPRRPDVSPAPVPALEQEVAA